MRLHRFFVKQNIGDRPTLEILEERIVHQVRNVFRLEVDDKVIIFDGSGFDFECEILQIDKKGLNLKILDSKKVFVPEKKVTLFMSIIKKENFELVCEKACELGVSVIVPVVTSRTLVKNLNYERIGKIFTESSEQCGRGDIPILGEVQKLEDILDNNNLFVCDMNGKEFRDWVFGGKSISLLIGPEGGWSDDERRMFHNKNLDIISLGDTVLRAETAGILATALVLI